MKRRWIRLGPATTLTMAGAIVVAYVRFPLWQGEAEQAHQLEVARAGLSQRSAPKALPLRSLQTLWNERAALNLSPSQLRALQNLQAQEARQLAPLKRNADLARRDFEVWMRAHQNGASLVDIQDRSAVYSAASAPLTQERQRFWNRALSLLSRAQRSQIEAKTQSQP